MTRLDDYATKYQTVRMERRDGILQMMFHTDGGPLQWGLLPHGEFPQAFRDVGSDPDNKVVILTGTGDTYSGPRAAGGTGMRSTPAQWDRVYWEGKHLLMSLLDIEVPMISAINGPAWRHSEIPLLCDIVLAADDVQFQDSAHFPNGMVPGDGMHIIYPLLLGWPLLLADGAGSRRAEGAGAGPGQRAAASRRSASARLGTRRTDRQTARAPPALHARALHPAAQATADRLPGLWTRAGRDERGGPNRHAVLGTSVSRVL
jgi:enoyl-CoA hydratase/carnithine racemase